MNKGKLQTVFKENSFYKVFLISLIVTGLGYGIYKGIIDNYMAEIVGSGLLGMTAWMLNHARGISLSARMNFFCFISSEFYCNVLYHLSE